MTDEEFREKLRKHTRVSHTGCVLWTGRKSDAGYGLLSNYKGAKPAYFRAHRVAAHLSFGLNLKSELHVLHHCDTPSCVNPEHLYAGTQADNVRDMVKRGRQRGGQRKRGSAHPGSKLTEASVAQIRERYAAGGITQTELANEYQVSAALIGFVVTRRNWTHI